MKLAILGLGRMGGNMVRRLLQGGHQVVAYNRHRGPIDELVQQGAIPAYTLEDVVRQLEPPRVVWMMLPAGEPTGHMIDAITPMLSAGDILIDGGNAFWKDSVTRANLVKQEGIHYLDIGVSGGIWGLEIGYCMMAGGDPEPFREVEPALKTLAPPDGYAHVGPSGSGHFSKMVHNGIEYGMMEAYAEGFEILHAAPFDYDLAKLANLWDHGSVIRSWLLELAERAFSSDPNLEKLRGYVEDSGEGRWTVAQAIEEDVPAPVITLSLLMRLRSRQDESFSAKVLAALRHEFGGHAVQAEIGTEHG